MTQAKTVEDLRQGIAQWRSSGERFAPELLRQEVTEHCRLRLQAGLSRRAVAGELGLKENTMQWWLSRRERQPGKGRRGVFQRVQVVEAEPLKALVLYAPRGVRVEGLSVDELAVLLVKLS